MRTLTSNRISGSFFIPVAVYSSQRRQSKAEKRNFPLRQTIPNVAVVITGTGQEKCMLACELDTRTIACCDQGECGCADDDKEEDDDKKSSATVASK